MATLLCVYACANSTSSLFPDPVAQGGGGGLSGSGGSGGSGTGFGGTEDDGGLIYDGHGGDPFDPDAACATALEEATTRQFPVDIVWMVDNSSSMAPAVAEVKQGLNAFAGRIAGSMLDYRVIVLSLRDRESPITVSGSTRYPVCIPPPLAGDDNCGDGERFFQSSVDLRSTQPLEQFLGTLGQTAGYSAGEQRGGEPWAEHLRPEATKTIVIVTDDNARLSVTDFETFAGGRNPFNSLTLPPGILDPSWGGLFDGYVFSGIYGWGSESDPSVKCLFGDGTEPASSGPTYSTLVSRTNGVRAKLCDGHAAWDSFFEAVAQAVVATSRLSCELDIPVPSTGTLDHDAVNVRLTDGTTEEILYRVDNAAACGADGGWYYDDPASPSKVLLCQGSCDRAQTLVGPGKDGRIEVLFGCASIVR
jgi:hypothetical protein